jgi:oxygen-independent coproporphyrinogen-3 oxidase
MGDAVRRGAGQGRIRPVRISNYARPGRESVHNSLYWRGGENAAAGCGACGFLRQGGGGLRFANDRSPDRYMERVENTGTGESSMERVSPDDHLRERMFTGLRLAEGIDLLALERDLDVPVRDRYGAHIARIVSDGLGSFDGTVLRLNDRGLDLHSEVSLRFF